MADYEFPSALYPSVRAAINAELDAVVLPDDTLALDIYEGATERWVMKRMESDEWETAGYADRVHGAATLYMASLVAPTIRQVTSARVPAGNLSFATMDMKALAENLLTRANEAMSEITADLGHPEPTTSLNPHFFTVAPRRRF